MLGLAQQADVLKLAPRKGALAPVPAPAPGWVGQLAADGAQLTVVMELGGGDGGQVRPLAKYLHLAGATPARGLWLQPSKRLGHTHTKPDL